MGNRGRVHQTLRVTPAMEAGITDHVWSVGIEGEVPLTSESRRACDAEGAPLPPMPSLELDSGSTVRATIPGLRTPRHRLGLAGGSMSLRVGRRIHRRDSQDIPRCAVEPRVL